MTPKSYKLLKDLPDAKAGDIYKWNGGSYSNQNRTVVCLHQHWVEYSPDWFQPCNLLDVNKNEDWPAILKKVATDHLNEELSEIINDLKASQNNNPFTGSGRAWNNGIIFAIETISHHIVK